MIVVYLTCCIAYPKYKDSQVRYFVDNAIVKHVSGLKEGNKIDNLAKLDDFEIKYFKNYTSKELNKFLLDLLKKHYNSKLLFDDSYYIANIIKA